VIRAVGIQVRGTVPVSEQDHSSRLGLRFNFMGLNGRRWSISYHPVELQIHHNDRPNDAIAESQQIRNPTPSI